MSREIWENIFSTRGWGRYPSVNLVRYTARNFYHLRDESHLRVLEIGSGGGANLWYLAREGFEVNGIDFSKSACQQSIELLRSEKLEDRIGKITCGDFVTELDDFEDEYFDLIIDIEGLSNVGFADAELVVRKIARKLNPAGKFFSQTFSGEMWEKNSAPTDTYHSVVPKTGTTSNLGVLRFATEQDLFKIYENEKLKVTEIQKTVLKSQVGEILESEWLVSCVKQ